MGKVVKNTLAFPICIEPNGPQPLDNRAIVENIEDLTNGTIAASAVYDGLQVIVQEDHNIYILTDKKNPTLAASWKKIGDVSGDISDLQEQITAVKSTAGTNKAAIDRLNGADTVTGSVANLIKTEITNLDVTNNTSVEVNGVKVTVNEADGKVQTPVVTIKTGAVAKGDTNLVTGAVVRAAIDTAVASAYKVKGCKDNFSDLPTTGNVEGDVWNIKNAFTLKDDNKPYPAGTNVVWIGEHTDGSTTHAAHWDALGGTVDLSGYVQRKELGSAAAMDAGSFATATQGALADTAMQGAAGDDYITATAGGSQGKTVTVTSKVAKMAEVKDETVALADAKDVKTYVDTKVSGVDTGVTSLGGQKGEITLDAPTTGVKLEIGTDKKLKGSLAGAAVAKSNLSSDVQTSLGKADNAVQFDDISSGTVTIAGDFTTDEKLVSNAGVLQLGGEAKTPYDITVTSDQSNGNNAALTFAEGGNNVVLQGIATPELNTDAANKEYVDQKTSGMITKVTAYTQSTGLLNVGEGRTANEVSVNVVTQSPAGASASKNGIPTALQVKEYVDTSVGAVDAGVITFGGQKGAITVDSGKTATGAVNFTVGTDKKLTGTVAGLGTAAGRETSDFALLDKTKPDFQSDYVSNSGFISTDLGFSAGGLTSDRILIKTYIDQGGIRFIKGARKCGIEVSGASLHIGAYTDDGFVADDIRLSGVSSPTDVNDAANKQYVDNTVSSALTWTEI